MEAQYRVMHIFNYMLKGSRPHQGKFNLAKIAMVQGSNKEIKMVLIRPAGAEEFQTPEAYLRAELPGLVTCS